MTNKEEMRIRFERELLNINKDGLHGVHFDGEEYTNSVIVQGAWFGYQLGYQQGAKDMQERCVAVCDEIIEINSRPHLVARQLAKENVEHAEYYKTRIQSLNRG